MFFWLYLLYGIIGILSLPLVVVRLCLRMLREPAYRPYWQERLGLSPAPHPSWPKASARVWIHAVSLGETRAVASLVHALAKAHPKAAFLLTHSTPNGRLASETLLRPALGNRLNVCYLPYDIPGWTHSFVRQWLPSVCLLVETELWPWQLQCNKSLSIPTLLISARLSKRSARGYARLGRLTRSMLNSLSGILAQDNAALRRFRALGFNGKGSVFGNLKFDPIPPSPDQLALGKRLAHAWQQTGADEPLLKVILASSRPGEEEAWLKSLHNRYPRATHEARSARLAITLIPRHIERCDEITKLAQQYGWQVQRKSQWNGESLDPATTLLLGDTIGELVGFYHGNDMALLGGSFGHYGAQNPLEALFAGCALVIGPSRFNFHSIVRSALYAKAALSAQSTDEALLKIEQSLQHRDVLDALRTQGKAFCDAHSGIVRHYVNVIDHHLY